jgi:hypothetical protein
VKKPGDSNSRTFGTTIGSGSTIPELQTPRLLPRQLLPRPAADCDGAAAWSRVRKRNAPALGSTIHARRRWQVFQRGDVHDGNAGRAIVQRGVSAASHADDHVSLTDENEIGMENVEVLAGTDDDAHGLERRLPEARLDIFGTEHGAGSSRFEI